MPLVVYSGVSLLLVMAVRAPADADAADDLEGRLELLVISDAEKKTAIEKAQEDCFFESIVG